MIIQGVEGKSHVADEVGVYTVIAIEGFCQSAASLPVEVMITGVDEYTDVVEIYPNPAREVIHLRNGSDLPLNRAVLRNSTGQLITEYTLNGVSHYELNLPEMQNGIYYLEFFTENRRVLVHRIIRQ